MKTFTAKEARHAMLDEPGREMVRVVVNRHIDTFRFSGNRFELFEEEVWVEFYPGHFAELGDGYLTAYHWLDEWEAERKAEPKPKPETVEEALDAYASDTRIGNISFIKWWLRIFAALKREIKSELREEMAQKDSPEEE